MSYQISLEEILLPKWQAWEGDGVSQLPARNVVFNSGAHGSLIMSSEGITLYNVRLHHLNTPRFDESQTFMTGIDRIEHLDTLKHLLSDSILNEISSVWNKYIERENSFVA